MCDIRNPPSLKSRIGKVRSPTFALLANCFAMVRATNRRTIANNDPPHASIGLCSCCHPSQTNAVNHLLTDISDCQLAAPTTPNRRRSRRWGTGCTPPGCPQTREQTSPSNSKASGSSFRMVASDRPQSKQWPSAKAKDPVINGKFQDVGDSPGVPQSRLRSPNPR